jgi:hypothetical protein
MYQPAVCIQDVWKPGSIETKVVNSVSVGVLFFQLEWNVSVSECFGVPFRGCTVNIYIYIYIYFQQT